MAAEFDRRITAARPDLAASSLKGLVEAPRYADGTPAQVIVGRASLRAAPSDAAAQDSELLYGENVTVYERKDGWAWVQAAGDHYVGYLRESALGDVPAPTSRVCALIAPVFPAPDLKKPVQDLLPMNAVVPALSRSGDYVQIAPDRWLHSRHVSDATESDFVSVAQRFVGVPYVWGGKTFDGLDCSGLIQTALAACGTSAPRDTDMMEKLLGAPIALDEAKRGDLIFWKGHMGVVLDGGIGDGHLLHANAFHMQVAIEPLAEAIARIQGVAGPVTAVKRL